MGRTFQKGQVYRRWPGNSWILRNFQTGLRAIQQSHKQFNTLQLAIYSGCIQVLSMAVKVWTSELRTSLVSAHKHQFHNSNHDDVVRAFLENCVANGRW